MSELLKHLSWLDDKQDAMVGLLTRICNVNSGTFNLPGIRDVVEMLRTEFEPIADSTELLGIPAMQSVDERGEVVDRPLGQAIRFRSTGESNRSVLLCIHTDTVYPIDSAFQTCDAPSDGQMRGPGVADAKGGIVVMLFALRCLAASPLARRISWEVLLNPDEEIGSPGSVELFDDCAEHNDFGLLFEPAYPDGSLVGRRKGSGNFTFVIRGRSAHAGREFDKGRNAIVQAADVVRQIDELNANKEGITYNAGKISGGGPLNIVPDLAIVRANVRINDFPDIEMVEKQFAKIGGSISERDGFSCQLHGQFTSPPKLLDEATKQIQKEIDGCAGELEIETSWVETGGASDGNKLFAAGLPNIDTMGVVGGNIHSDQEYVVLDSLIPRAKLTALMLMKHATKNS